jgi:hypothetical protein
MRSKRKAQAVEASSNCRQGVLKDPVPWLLKNPNAPGRLFDFLAGVTDDADAAPISFIAPTSPSGAVAAKEVEIIEVPVSADMLLKLQKVLTPLSEHARPTRDSGVAYNVTYDDAANQVLRHHLEIFVDTHMLGCGWQRAASDARVLLRRPGGGPVCRLCWPWDYGRESQGDGGILLHRLERQDIRVEKEGAWAAEHARMALREYLFTNRCIRFGVGRREVPRDTGRSVYEYVSRVTNLARHKQFQKAMSHGAVAFDDFAMTVQSKYMCNAKIMSRTTAGLKRYYVPDADQHKQECVALQGFVSNNPNILQGIPTVQSANRGGVQVYYPALHIDVGDEQFVFERRTLRALEGLSMTAVLGELCLTPEQRAGCAAQMRDEEFLLKHGMNSAATCVVWPYRAALMQCLADALNAELCYVEFIPLDDFVRTSSTSYVFAPAKLATRAETVIHCGGMRTLMWNAKVGRTFVLVK